MAKLSIDISELILCAQEQLVSKVPCTIDYLDRAALANNQLPPSLEKSLINIYALWKRNELDEKWELMYIGQRSSMRGWSRVKQLSR